MTTKLMIAIFAFCLVAAASDDHPVKLLRTQYVKGEIAKLCSDSIAKADAKIKDIASTPAERRTFANTMGALEEVLADFNDETAPLAFMSYVYTDKDVRAEGSDCEAQAAQYGVDVFTRKDLYNAVKDAKPGNDAEKRLREYTLNKFLNNGLQLPDDQLKQVKKLMQNLADLEAKYSANLNNDVSTVSFTLDELQGLPESFISGLKKDADGKYIVTTKEPDYIAVTENAVRSETRKRMTFGYSNRQGVENTQLLEQAVQLRQKIAQMLGKKSWAEYQITNRTAKNDTEVWNFLNGLAEKLKQRNQQDLQKLLAAKQQDDPNATNLNSWDINFTPIKFKKEIFNWIKKKLKNTFHQS